MPRRALPTNVAQALARAAKALQVNVAAARIGSSYRSRGIQKVLRDEMFEGCCCFCEVSTETSNYGQVEHYRPKGRPEFKHLAYSWNNLLWACGRCNGPKGDHWNHAAPLVDPCDPKDRPELHLRWVEAKLVEKTPRGKYTIDLLDLNGVKNLRRYEERRTRFTEVRLLWRAAAGVDTNMATEARAVLVALLGRGGQYRAMLAEAGMALASIP